MNRRQEHALLNPLNVPASGVAEYRSVRRHARGFLLVAVLAVDR